VVTEGTSSDGRATAPAVLGTAIELVGVAKDYGARTGDAPAVERVDLAIGAGEFFSLLGPSGCGKTTTLRMIAGFEEPTSGRILLYGKDVVGVPPHHRDVNLVFQSYALFPHMNVYDNIAFGLRRRRVAKDEIDARVRRILHLVGLEGKERSRPRELSGGQQQRVALARAVVNEPRALLLDEPLGALDLKLRQAMQLELKRIQREVGITFVYVTHDQGEALTMSDRIAVMNHGRVEQLGTPREIYETPATRFVAGFIGTSNLLTAKVERVDGRVAVLGSSADERLVVVTRRAVAPGDEVELTVRPEKITLTAERPEPGSCALRGRVTDVVYLGTSTSFTVRTSAGADIVAHRQNLSSAPAGIGEGSAVWISWDDDHSYALDRVEP